MLSANPMIPAMPPALRVAPRPPPLPPGGRDRLAALRALVFSDLVVPAQDGNDGTTLSGMSNPATDAHDTRSRCSHAYARCIASSAALSSASSGLVGLGAVRDAAAPYGLRRGFRRALRNPGPPPDRGTARDVPRCAGTGDGDRPRGLVRQPGPPAPAPGPSPRSEPRLLARDMALPGRDLRELASLDDEALVGRDHWRLAGATSPPCHGRPIRPWPSRCAHSAGALPRRRDRAAPCLVPPAAPPPGPVRPRDDELGWRDRGKALDGRWRATRLCCDCIATTLRARGMRASSAADSRRRRGPALLGRARLPWRRPAAEDTPLYDGRRDDAALRLPRAGPALRGRLVAGDCRVSAPPASRRAAGGVGVGCTPRYGAAPPNSPRGGCVTADRRALAGRALLRVRVRWRDRRDEARWRGMMGLRPHYCC